VPFSPFRLGGVGEALEWRKSLERCTPSVAYTLDRGAHEAILTRFPLRAPRPAFGPNG
jgi:hypothetical protein